MNLFTELLMPYQLQVEAARDLNTDNRLHD